MLTQLLVRNPNYRRARFVLADIYLFDGDSNRAIDQLRQALEHDPNDAMAHHALAQVLDASGQRSEALEHYEKAAKLEPKNGVYALSYNTARASTASTAAASNAAVASAPMPEAAPQKSAKPRTTSLTLTERPMPPTSARDSSVPAIPKPEAGRLDSKTSNSQQQQQPAKLASVDDWVRPMDFGDHSSDKPTSDAARKTVSVMTSPAAPSSSMPVVVGPVAARPAEAPSASAAVAESPPITANKQSTASEPAAKPAYGLATPASYSVASTKPADRQNQHNPLEARRRGTDSRRYGRGHPVGHSGAGRGSRATRAAVPAAGGRPLSPG